VGRLVVRVVARQVTHGARVMESQLPRHAALLNNTGFAVKPNGQSRCDDGLRHSYVSFFWGSTRALACPDRRPAGRRLHQPRSPNGGLWAQGCFLRGRRRPHAGARALPISKAQTRLRWPLWECIRRGQALRMHRQLKSILVFLAVDPSFLLTDSLKLGAIRVFLARRISLYAPIRYAVYPGFEATPAPWQRCLA
jgi:hypothetical protein